ncbi:reverse transcriptase domain-containing protein [Alkalibacillus haloalkaliphilus]|uniref:Reverse transcriptase n=1 Tax=Alkalibacillus haloalkaliphilus TaxID=94136 RepID=A0A511W055_9BACI|nr:reverse transcriptase domain-containing protein [Alkalibacillus haloalkaliphilus]GEN44467.1 reverse transcriptase [Alkalibacillus haloalkaliphilus]
MSASNLFRKYFSIKHLEITLDKYFDFTSATGIDQMNFDRFYHHRVENICKIKEKVKNNTYQFTPYKEKLIVKDRYSPPRLISIPTLRDKLVLKSLSLILSETYHHLTQPLPQLCISQIKESVYQYDSFIKLDVSDFYGTIKHGILFNLLEKRIKKEEILTLIKKSITTPTVKSGEKSSELITEGIPQGLPISNILSHIYLEDFDNKFENQQDYQFIRYVDDVLVLCNSKDLPRIYSKIKYELEGLYSLRLNDSKTELGKVNEGFSFLGYQVMSNHHGELKLTIKKANQAKFENSLVDIFTSYKYNSDNINPKQFVFRLNNKITGSISKKVDGDKGREFNYGWLFYFSQMNDTSVLYHLDWLIQKLLVKFEFDHINKDEIKSFVKAFYEVRYNYENSTYIHRPDELNEQQKKELLIDVFNVNVKNLKSKEGINYWYQKYVYRPIKMDEKDIKSKIS